MQICHQSFVGVWITLFDLLYEHPDLVTNEQMGTLISGLEDMLKRLLTRDESNEFDPFNAQAVGERLVQHYKKSGDAGQAERVLKSIGAAFQTIAEGAGAVLATAWLEPVAQRYEQEGLKADAEISGTSWKVSMPDSGVRWKTYSLPIEFKKDDVDALLTFLIADETLAGGPSEGLLHISLPR